MSIHYRIFSTTVGDMAIVFNEHGLVKVFLPEASVTKLRQKIKAEFGLAPASNDGQQTCIDCFQRYFEGEKVDFDVAIDWTGHSEFNVTVWKACRKIPYGQTMNYGKLAEAAHRPGAARAVGSAMAKNPFPIVVPCHRVIKSDGSLGEYSGPCGTDFKRELQDLESSAFLKAQ